MYNLLLRDICTQPEGLETVVATASQTFGSVK
jgi:hypothetical protein